MGKVFTWNEIERGRVPVIEEFTEVGNRLIEYLEMSHSSLLGAQIFGSFLRGDHDIRSDIDVVVVYDAQNHQPAIAAANAFSGIAVESSVPIEFVPISDDLSNTPYHHFGIPLLHHLDMRDVPSRIVRESPRSFLCDSGRSMIDDSIDYLKHKIRTLDKGLWCWDQLSHEKRCAYVENALSLPIYAARMYLQCLGEEFHNDAKDVVVEKFGQLPGHDLDIGFMAMVNSQDRLYTDVLMEMLHHEPDVQKYLTTLERLKPIGIISYNIAKSLLLRLGELKEETK